MLKPKDEYDDYVCHITEDDINMMSVMDWIGLDSERFGLIQLDWIGLNWIGLIQLKRIGFGLDWIGLDWIGLDWIGFD